MANDPKIFIDKNTGLHIDIVAMQEQISVATKEMATQLERDIEHRLIKLMQHGSGEMTAGLENRWPYQVVSCGQKH